MVNRVLSKINDKQISDKAKKSFDKHSESNIDFVFEQGVSSDTWIIRHNLNKKPSITIVDEYNRVVIAEEEYVSNNEIRLKFNFSFKGKAYLN